MSAPQHYNNDVSTLYLIAEKRNWSSYLFDIVKRLERRYKKGRFNDDVQKSLFLFDLWQNEFYKMPLKKIFYENEIPRDYVKSRGWSKDLFLIVRMLEKFQSGDSLVNDIYLPSDIKIKIAIIS